MTDNKTYWGLNEFEVNKLFKLTDKYKNLNNVFLSLEIKLQPEDTYEYFFNKIIEKYNDFIEDNLFSLNEHMISFKEQNKYNEYYDYLSKLI